MTGRTGGRARMLRHAGTRARVPVIASQQTDRLDLDQSCGAAWISHRAEASAHGEQLSLGAHGQSANDASCANRAETRAGVQEQPRRRVTGRESAAARASAGGGERRGRVQWRQVRLRMSTDQAAGRTCTGDAWGTATDPPRGPSSRCEPAEPTTTSGRAPRGRASVAASCGVLHPLLRRSCDAVRTGALPGSDGRHAARSMVPCSRGHSEVSTRDCASDRVGGACGGCQRAQGTESSE